MSGVIEPSPRRSGVQVLEVDRLRLVEAAGPRLSPEDRLAMDRVWEEAVRANPCLFDGPVVACARLDHEGPHDVVLGWVRTTYRHYALRRLPDASLWLPSLFVAVVQPSDDGCLLVGRMSSSTAAPGRWQLPGGSVEPPEGRDRLDAAALRRHAARELVEETGVDVAPDDLTLWVLTRGESGNVGVLFLAPCRPASLLRERFAAAVSSEWALGREPELDRIALVRSPAEVAGLGGPCVDYLEPVVRRYAGC
ncbi:NUDIX domain-containing protein [Microtetraspora niveoalba]|uniref:NUDIX domain-containing protein n=1 Tax=Microtetraspora niveoalba TaxID=46175 RepID=UPI0008303E27|nr:NUDIX domain-containing protein [Microtetraspora niveoalba]